MINEILGRNYVGVEILHRGGRGTSFGRNLTLNI
jgi:hypothetical protein